MSTTTTTIEQPVQPQSSPLGALFTPEVIGLIGVWLFIGFFMMRGGGKGKLADGRFTTGGEISKARKVGLKQIREAAHNQVALQFGKDGLVVPDAQRSTAIIGSSGSGKTDSVMDPSIDSAIEQGMTCLVYDVKGTLMKRHAAYAAAHGYSVYTFAPGFPYTDSLNILDFMAGPDDGAMAAQIARVLNANLRPVGAKEDAYFGPSGDALLKAIFMMARGSVYNDLLGAWEILSLPDLADRLVTAKHNGAISSWIRAAANGVMSVAGAADTVSGIVGTAVTSFGRLIDPLLLPSILTSTIPLDLPGKQIIFFQIDEQRESETAPLVAMAIHMLVTRNLNAQIKRKVPFFISLDEFTSIRLPEIEAWVNRFREYGMVLQLGYQSDSQLRMRYSPDYAKSIIASCSTKFVFSPGAGNTEVAEAWSKACGEKEVKYKTRSSGGRGGGNSTEHITRVPLITPDEICRFRSGECILLNPVYSRPYKLRIKRRKKDMDGRRECIETWERTLAPKLIERADKRRFDNFQPMTEWLNEELINRSVYADTILPSPEEVQKAKEQSLGVGSR